MLVIPVLDIRAGQVVHARRGQRDRYAPLQSRLAAGSEPLPLARALCDHCASRQLYVADLDALAGGAPQAGTIGALLAALPGVTLWLDAGFGDAASAARLRAQWPRDQAARVRPVFASESLRSRAALAEAMAVPAALLSLDRRDGQHLDPALCWRAPELWPREVIVMTLERVGSDAGPDLDTLRWAQAQTKARVPQTRFVGAGGVRHATDLTAAQAAGAAAWLVASALHDGRLDAAALRRLAAG